MCFLADLLLTYQSSARAVALSIHSALVTYHSVEVMKASGVTVEQLSIVVPGTHRKTQGIVDLVQFSCEFGLHGLKYILRM